MTEKQADQEFIEYIVKAFVDKPDQVTTTRTVDERGVLLELKVDPSDMGKVIGKQGQTAKAIRTLLRVVGAKNNARINFKIAEPEGGKKSTTSDKPSTEENSSSSIEDLEV